MAGIVGSVQVTGSTLGPQTAALPTDNLEIVAVSISGQPYITIPLDSSRQAVLPNIGYKSISTVQYLKTNWIVNGTSLNFTVPLSVSYTITFYYGSTLTDSQPLENYAGVVTQVTLSSGAGTGTLNFPAGKLTLTGMILLEETGNNPVAGSFSTSTGQKLTLAQLKGQVAYFEDIFGLSLPVSINLIVTLAGTSSDVIDIVGYYAFSAATPHA